MSSCYRESVRLWLSKQMVRKPHDLCWQLSAIQSVFILPLLITHPMCWTTRRSKEKQQMSHSFWYPEPSTGWSPVLVMLFWGEWILVDSAFWIGGLQNKSPVNSIKRHQLSPSPLQMILPVCLCVCIDIHAQACASLPLQYIWIAWMAYWLCISGSFVLAGRQIMRPRLHCWHQMTLFNKRYRQSADPTSSVCIWSITVFQHPLCCTCRGRGKLEMPCSNGKDEPVRIDTQL